MVPEGELVLDVWSVLLSDVIVCPSGSEGFGPECHQPTLGPASTCSVTVRLVAGQPAAFRYRVLPQERCQLGPWRGAEAARRAGWLLAASRAAEWSLAQREPREHEREANSHQDRARPRLAAQDLHRDRRAAGP